MPDRPCLRLYNRVTVVLLTFNCAHRIQPVLDQLAALDVPIVAVDNASTDGTADVLDRQPGLQVIRLSSNLGAAGRNVGAEQASTPYVAFCDDDGWYEGDGLQLACDLFDTHPELDLINARILVGDENRLDPISAEMAASPLPDRDNLPGKVLLSFMGGAVIVRVSAFQAAGGYHPRFFMGGEEETLSFPMAKRGSRMRYIPEIVVHHHPSLANAAGLRAHGMRNTLWNAWLHRRLRNALRWTIYVLTDTPKNRDYARGVLMTLRGLPWVLSNRHPMDSRLDNDLHQLDARRYATRRPFLTTRAWRPNN